MNDLTLAAVVEEGSEPLENIRWEKFCREYVGGDHCGNASKCYKLAGYKPKTENAYGHGGAMMLRKPVVKARIKWLAEQAYIEMEISQGEIVARAAAIARFDPAKLFDDGGNFKELKDVDVETRMALAAVEVDLFIPTPTKDNPTPVTIATKKVRAADKLGALRLLMLYRKMIGEGGLGGLNLQVNLTLADRLNNARKRMRERSAP